MMMAMMLKKKMGACHGEGRRAQDKHGGYHIVSMAMEGASTANAEKAIAV